MTFFKIRIIFFGRCSYGKMYGLNFIIERNWCITCNGFIDVNVQKVFAFCAVTVLFTSWVVSSVSSVVSLYLPFAYHSFNNRRYAGFEYACDDIGYIFRIVTRNIIVVTFIRQKSKIFKGFTDIIIQHIINNSLLLGGSSVII